MSLVPTTGPLLWALAADFDAGLRAVLKSVSRRACKTLQLMAEAGDAQSQFAIGMMFEGGYVAPPDLQKAVEQG